MYGQSVKDRIVHMKWYGQNSIDTEELGQNGNWAKLDGQNGRSYGENGKNKMLRTNGMDEMVLAKWYCHNGVRQK